MTTTYDMMTYRAERANRAENSAWMIRADDGTGVIVLPFDMPALVAEAIACAFTSEAARLERKE